MGAYETVKALNTSWISKGDAAKNVFDRFIYYWIAFNAFYSYKTGESRDRMAVTIIGADGYLINLYQAMLQKDNSPLDRLRNLQPAVLNRNEIRLEITNGNLDEVLNVLYEVRCNLFHGDKGESIERDQQVIEASTPMLEALVKEFAATF